MKATDHTSAVRTRGREILDALDGERLLLAVEALMAVENLHRHAADIDLRWQTVRMAEREVAERESALQRASKRLSEDEEENTSPETPRAKFLTRTDIEKRGR